jgi:hypothetical protein
MKRFFVITLAMSIMFMASGAYAFSIGGEFQNQNQGLFLSPNSPTSNQLDIGFQSGEAGAFSASSAGDASLNQNAQSQNIIFSDADVGPTGNVSQIDFDLTTGTAVYTETGAGGGGGFAAGGAEVGHQSGALVLNNQSGTAAVAGSGQGFQADTGVVAFGDASATASAGTTSMVTYQSLNSSATGNALQSQSGQSVQDLTLTSAATGPVGVDVDSIDAYQAGGSAMVQNGAGTSQAAGSGSGGFIINTDGASGMQAQQHVYTQTQTSGPFSQVQSGMSYSMNSAP